MAFLLYNYITIYIYITRYLLYVMKDNNIKNVLSKTFCVTYNILHNIHNSL